MKRFDAICLLVVFVCFASVAYSQANAPLKLYQTIPLPGSVGESNAVFLRGVGGDAATEPHKTGCSGYPEEEFSGTHMDLNASIFKPDETNPQPFN